MLRARASRICSTNPTSLRYLYFDVMRPHLDYAVRMSAPHLQNFFKQVERMFRIVTCCGKDFGTLPYPVRLFQLNLPSVQLHFPGMLPMYLLVYNYLNLPSIDVFEASAACYIVRHSFKVRQPYLHLARRRADFTIRSAAQ